VLRSGRRERFGRAPILSACSRSLSPSGSCLSRARVLSATERLGDCAGMPFRFSVVITRRSGLLQHLIGVDLSKALSICVDVDRCSCFAHRPQQWRNDGDLRALEHSQDQWRRSLWVAEAQAAGACALFGSHTGRSYGCSCRDNLPATVKSPWGITSLVSDQQLALDRHPAAGDSECHTAPGLREPAWPLRGHRPWRSRDLMCPCRRREVWR
jgi:hypothetical protein